MTNGGLINRKPLSVECDSKAGAVVKINKPKKRNFCTH